MIVSDDTLAYLEGFVENRYNKFDTLGCIGMAQYAKADNRRQAKDNDGYTTKLLVIVTAMHLYQSHDAQRRGQ